MSEDVLHHAGINLMHGFGVRDKYPHGKTNWPKTVVSVPAALLYLASRA